MQNENQKINQNPASFFQLKEASLAIATPSETAQKASLRYDEAVIALHKIKAVLIMERDDLFCMSKKIKTNKIDALNELINLLAQSETVTYKQLSRHMISLDERYPSWRTKGHRVNSRVEELLAAVSPKAQSNKEEDYCYLQNNGSPYIESPGSSFSY